MATTILSRTPGVEGNRRKWTFSTWVKLGAVSGSRAIFGSPSDGSNYNELWFQDGDFRFDQQTSGSPVASLITDRVFRDPAAWYNIVCVWDSDNAAAGDRMKMYVNGVEETSFSTDTNPALNLDSYVNSTSYPLEVGGMNAGEYFGGVLAHTHFTDGQAYAASDFGETDSTSGIWIAKTSPSVTYGTNGFFLKYQDTSAFGDDSSGNNNDMAVSGTMTQTKDNPDNNFCTWNLLTQSGGTYSNGNTSRTAGDDTGGTLGVTKGKWYWEYKRTNTSNSIHYGICSTSNGFNNAGQQMLNGGTDAVGASLWLSEGGTATDAYGNAGGFSSVSYSVPSVSISNGDVIGCALDISTSSGTVEWFQNGVSLGTASFTYDDSVPVYPFIRLNTSVTTDTNFGNGYFGTTVISSAGTSSSGDDSIWEYDCPADHYGLNTNNIATYG
jgi:hypothetical protein